MHHFVPTAAADDEGRLQLKTGTAAADDEGRLHLKTGRYCCVVFAKL